MRPRSFRRKPGALCVVLALSLFAVGAAQAEEEEEEEAEYARPGIYLGVAGVYAVENFQRTGGVGVDDSAGLNGVFGYRANEDISVEVQMEWIDGFDLDNTPADDASVLLWTANAKLHFLHGRIQPFAVYGMGIMRVSVDDRPGGDENNADFAMRAGGGLDFYVTEKIALSADAQYIWPISAVDDYDYISLAFGAKYRF